MRALGAVESLLRAFLPVGAAGDEVVARQAQTRSAAQGATVVMIGGLGRGNLLLGFHADWLLQVVGSTGGVPAPRRGPRAMARVMNRLAVCTVSCSDWPWASPATIAAE